MPNPINSNTNTSPSAAPQTVAEQAKSQQLAVVEKTVSDAVFNRVNALTKAGRLNLPADYSIGNAMSSAWLRIIRTKDRNGRPALDVCTRESVTNTLLEMAILGLSMAKDQCYPIVYGTELTCFVSVHGKMAAISRLKGVESQPVAALIFDGDEVEIGFTDEGEMEVKSHKTSWANVQKGTITGAYASVRYKGQKRTAVLPMKEILEGWSKSQADKEHKTFTGEFAKRSALNRLAKVIVKSSTDEDILAETLDENEARNFDFTPDPEKVIETVKQDVQKTTASVTPPPPAPKPEPKPEPKPVISDEEADRRMNADNVPPTGQTALPIDGKDNDLPF